MTIGFYRRSGDAAIGKPPRWPKGCELRSWRPAYDGPPPRGPHFRENLVWFAFDQLGLFGSRAFEELQVWRDGRLAHRLIVTPRWFRFPFMGRDDLQIGALWTDPQARRLGLARAAIAEAHRRHAAQAGGFWYVADDANPASAGLAEACGYRRVGVGRRTRRLGLRVLGQFVMEPATTPPGR